MRGFERFSEVFRGFQRFLEVFRGFSKTLSETLSECHFPLRVAGVLPLIVLPLKTPAIQARMTVHASKEVMQQHASKEVS